MLEATLMIALVLGVFWLCARAPRPCGYRVCMDCHKILGRATWLPAGECTHGICKQCAALRIAEEEKSA